LPKPPPREAETSINKLESTVYFFVFVIKGLNQGKKLNLAGEADDGKHRHANE
jgi:hypothetical protein